MIIDVQGTAGIVQQSVPVAPISADTQVRLKYFHFPDLPLLDAYPDAVTVGAESFTIPAVSSIQQLVNELDSLAVAAGTRICYVWYNYSEFELCVGPAAITLTQDFADVVKLPVDLLAHTCYSTSLFEPQLSNYSHYAVQVSGVKGFFSDNDYNTVIAKVRRDGDISAAHTHSFRGNSMTIDLAVTVVKKDGTIKEYTSPEVWSLGLEIID